MMVCRGGVGKVVAAVTNNDDEQLNGTQQLYADLPKSAGMPFTRQALALCKKDLPRKQSTGRVGLRGNTEVQMI